MLFDATILFHLLHISWSLKRCWMLPSCFISSTVPSPWYNHTSWLGVKYQLTYLLHLSYVSSLPHFLIFEALFDATILFHLLHISWSLQHCSMLPSCFISSTVLDLWSALRCYHLVSSPPHFMIFEATFNATILFHLLHISLKQWSHSCLSKLISNNWYQ